MSSTSETINPLSTIHPRPLLTPRSSRWASLLLFVLLTAFLFTFAYAGFLLYHWAREVVAHASQLPAISLSDLSLPMQDNAAAGVDPVQTPNPDSPAPVVQAVPTWDLSRLERVNILVLGVDQRPSQTIPGLTDSMMLITIDPAHGQVGMLSIPRDTWVKIPGYEIYNKINTAHRIGDIKNYPGGGPALAKQTVSELIGYPVHYYVRLNFEGFREVIDYVGGLDIDVPRDLNDPTYPSDDYGFDPLFIPKGLQHMDGTLALKYARTRHVDNDFGRARRQQQVLLALKNKILSQGMLPTLIRNLPGLARSLAQSVQTDIPLDRLIALAELGRQVDFNQIEQAVIDCSMGECTYSEAGAWILIPDRNKIRAVVDRLFAAPIATAEATPTPLDGSPAITNTVTPTATMTLDRQRLAAENAKIILLNGTETPGLARRTAAWLQSLGFVVEQLGDADASTYERGTLIAYTDKRYTLGQLAAIFNVTASEVRNPPPDQANLDIRLVLGKETLDILTKAGVK